jgi:alkyldihydroxyacetonephosphate synthase
VRRWNGWGDDATNASLNPQALQMLRSVLGDGVAPVDASLDEFLARVPSSRIDASLAGSGPAIATDAASRFAVALGESYPDWAKKRTGVVPPVPDGVAHPLCDAEVRALLDLAQANHWIVIPFAGGTSVCGHLDVPLGERPVLSIKLTRMNRLLHLDPRSQLARFEAGTPGPQVEAQLRAHGYTLGHFPQSFEFSTVGGWVVTRSSGQQSLRYGRIEQLFAGGRLQAPLGCLDLPTLPASAAGPDLRELVMGSEGRFGILTEVELRVRRAPGHESFHALFFPSWDVAEAGVRELVQAQPGLSMLRLSNAIETRTTLTMAGHPRLIKALGRYLDWRGCGDDKCVLMVGVTGDSGAARFALKSARHVLKKHGAVTIGPAIGKKWAANRFRGPYLRNALWDAGYSVDTLETAVDWPQVKPLMHAMEQAARDAFAHYQEPVHAFTHLSHVYAQGSSIYSQFVWKTAPGGFAPNFERWQRYKNAVSKVIAEHGGTVSHQHGVGRDHAANLHVEKGPIGMATLARLCAHFDPQGMMNPGKLLPDGGPWAEHG